MNLEETIRNALKPDPVLLVSEWADKHRFLSTKSSSEPGQWKTSRTPYLKEIMDVLSTDSLVETVVFMKGAQVGAALPLDTPIPTPNGMVSMADLEVGSEVYGMDGKPTKVTWKSEVFEDHDCYEITFFDGTKQIADAGHRWLVWDQKSKKKVKELVVKTTAELVEEGLFFSNRVRSRWAVPVCQAVEGVETELPIDPYTLGYWLGNGHSRQRCIYMDRKDVQSVRDSIPYETLYSDKHQKGNGCELRIKFDGFMPAIYALNLYRNKHIPEDYLNASVPQRVALLQGLMDSDGSIGNNRREFSNRSKKLVQDFETLISSLGIKYSRYVKREMQSYCGQKGPIVSTYRVSFTTFSVDCFRNPRKKTRQKTEGRVKETEKRFITHVEKVDSVPTQCIAVDNESHSYLCGKNHLVTHNSEMGNNWLGYIIDHAPGPTLLVQPTVDMAKRNSKTRIEPMIEETPRLKQKVSVKKSRDSNNTILQKDFPGGTVVMAGANSASGLRSMPARYLFTDEEDAYPGDLDGEGDPVDLARARTRTFARRKHFRVSTPTIHGRSRIENAFARTDKRYYFVPCPHCGHKQTLRFSQLKWPKENPRAAKYECEECHEEIENWQKTEMLAGGDWRVTDPDFEAATIRGYHLSSLYSPVGWFSWGEVAEEFVKAKKTQEGLKTFVNTVLGETFKEKTEKPDWKRIYERREPYKRNVIPDLPGFLTAAVDVQKDRLECEIKFWTINRESYSVDYRVFPGDTSEFEVYQSLDKLLAETWELKNGLSMGLKGLGIDSGYNTQVVYNWVRGKPSNRVFALKGSEKMTTIIGHPKATDINHRGKKIARGVKVWPVGINHIKTELYGFLRQSPPIDEDEGFPMGYCHYPEYEPEFFRMLTAEEVVTRVHKGYTKHEWQKTRERNESLDTHVYNRAVACILGYDRLSDENLEAMKPESVKPVVKTSETSPTLGQKPNKPKRKRRESDWL